jgi:peptidoglycan-associated lipoprotein
MGSKIMQKSALVKILGLTFGAVLMTACASNSNLAGGDSAGTTGVEGQPVTGEQMGTAANEAQAALMETTVFYFDFDQTTIKADSKNSLIAHSQYLAANSSASVVLEGHADERGTVEYNLALAERRAISVSRFLQANGVASSQINAVSFGEERPALMGHNDDSWSQNRRVEIKY